jgi:hypothetical protein
VFRYRLHSPDGDDLGEATYAQMIHPGDEIHLGSGQRFRVLDVVQFSITRSAAASSQRSSSFTATNLCRPRRTHHS